LTEADQFGWEADPHSPHAYAQLNSNPVEDLGQIVSSPWAMPWEQRNHIYLCHNLKGSLRDFWPKVKEWL
jgi:hypothetical protein